MIVMFVLTSTNVLPIQLIVNSFVSTQVTSVYMNLYGTTIVVSCVAGSFVCGCKPGYSVDKNDSRKCVDVNECLINNGGCQQECINNGT